MNRVILVTAIGGDVGHSILKCLTSESDVLIGCDIDSHPVGLDVVDQFFSSLPVGNEDYISQIANKCKIFNVTHLIPVSEHEIEKIIKHLDVFKRLNVKVLINTKEIVDTCLDKYLTAKRLENLGLDIPDYFTEDEFVSDGRKYMVKFRKSCGSKLLTVITTQKELNKIRSSVSEPLIIQEYIDESDQEYTVGVFSDGHEIRVIAFQRRLKGGYTKFVRLVDDSSITRDAIIAAQGLGLVGSFNIQLRKSNGKNYIFEINPRISGTVNFRHMLGFDDVRWWLDILDQKEVKPYLNEYKSAIGIREMNEKFLLLN
ncbi:ATP-grasp domain-containing protein [Sporosarcina ureae]|uniref:ATP-grasp domain-containing protein n=1 Tax=Sporosarcina ureae TaxID=1571 RepID=UPI0026EE7EBE|nr:ATP-grasp domain-containing protein [Sporosarcina ureae]